MTFRDRLELELGEVHLELIHTDIHSDDASLVWWPDRQLLFCGDTMEDTVTYVDEPTSLPTHRANLEKLRLLGPKRILPNHGAPEVIAAGGYSEELIAATQRYIDFLLRVGSDETLARLTLNEVVSDLGSDEINYHTPYEAVHRSNVDAMRRKATV